MFHFVAESDLHGGNSYGLVHPSEVRTKYKWYAETLWDWRTAKIAEIGPIDMYLNLGELCDGPGNADNGEHWATDAEEQAQWAADCVLMWPCGDYRLCYGSAYHRFRDANAELEVVKNIRAKNKSATIQDMQRIEIKQPEGSCKINARHHIGASSTTQGQAGQLAKAAGTDLLRSVYRDYPGADLYMRAHWHGYFFAGNDLFTAINTPALQWPCGKYGRRMDRPWYTMGLIEGWIHDNGEFDIKPHLLKVKLPEEKYAVIG